MNSPMASHGVRLTIDRRRNRSIRRVGCRHMDNLLKLLPGGGFRQAASRTFASSDRARDFGKLTSALPRFREALSFTVHASNRRCQRLMIGETASTSCPAGAGRFAASF